MKKSKYLKEYLGTRAGKIPVTFTTIEKNNEANYKKVFDEEIEYYKAQDIDVEESLFSRCMVPDNKSKGYMIIPRLFEPPVRTLRATIPEIGSHIFR